MLVNTQVHTAAQVRTDPADQCVPGTPCKEQKGYFQVFFQQRDCPQAVQKLSIVIRFGDDLYHIRASALLLQTDLQHPFCRCIPVQVRGYQHLCALSVKLLDQCLLLYYSGWVHRQFIGIFTVQVTHHIAKGRAPIR